MLEIKHYLFQFHRSLYTKEYFLLLLSKKYVISPTLTSKTSKSYILNLFYLPPSHQPMLYFTYMSMQSRARKLILNYSLPNDIRRLAKVNR